MRRFVVLRLVHGVGTLFLLSLLVFVLIRMTGSPLDVLMGDVAQPEDLEYMARKLGLDKPLIVQYGIYVFDLIRGDFGQSIASKAPVLDLILARLPNSIKLAAFSMVMGMSLAFPVGIISAVKRGGASDFVARLIALLGQCLPNFWLGLVLIEVFAVRLGVLPTSGMGGIGHYILPGITLGWFVVAGMMRLLRSSMLDALDSEYIKLAKIKGLSETKVIWKHALKNALIPVVTFSGMYFAILVTSAIVVEAVFVWPGVGRLLYQGILLRDFPVVQGMVFFGAAVIVAVNLAVDILYAFIDPRMRHGVVGQTKGAK